MFMNISLIFRVTIISSQSKQLLSNFPSYQNSKILMRFLNEILFLLFMFRADEDYSEEGIENYLNLMARRIS